MAGTGEGEGSGEKRTRPQNLEPSHAVQDCAAATYLCQRLRLSSALYVSIYAAALGFVGSRFSLSALKPNLALSSCTNRAVCALCRMCVSNAPRAIPNISTPSNNRTSGAELTIDTV